MPPLVAFVHRLSLLHYAVEDELEHEFLQEFQAQVLEFFRFELFQKSFIENRNIGRGDGGGARRSRRRQ